MQQVPQDWPGKVKHCAWWAVSIFLSWIVGALVLPGLSHSEIITPEVVDYGQWAILIFQLYALIEVGLGLRALTWLSSHRADKEAHEHAALGAHVVLTPSWLYQDVSSRCTACSRPLIVAWTTVECLACKRKYHDRCWREVGARCVGEDCPHTQPSIDPSWTERPDTTIGPTAGPAPQP
ncbi:hypothetical protein LLH03_01450 [bacterium]|nr:hypothetical protein [bacterium]